MKLSAEVGLGPGHFVLDGDAAPSKRGTVLPLSAHVYIATKRLPISAAAEHLL